jgi:hypothetical protein
VRAAVSGILLLAVTVVGTATAGDKLTGSWKSHPNPEEGKLVVEFFADGTGLFTHARNKDMSGLFGVRESKQAGVFDFIGLEEGNVWATFQVKAPGVAVMTATQRGQAFRMIPGGIDD